MGLITSLLKPWRFGLNLKNTKKIILFILIPRIINLYIKCIPDIKRNKCKNIFWF